jgi:hypothetical protein
MKSNFKMMRANCQNSAGEFPIKDGLLFHNVRGMPSGYRQHMSIFKFFRKMD